MNWPRRSWREKSIVSRRWQSMSDSQGCVGQHSQLRPMDRCGLRCAIRAPIHRVRLKQSPDPNPPASVFPHSDGE